MLPVELFDVPPDSETVILCFRSVSLPSLSLQLKHQRRPVRSHFCASAISSAIASAFVLTSVFGALGAQAQGFGGRAATVEVSASKEEVLAITTDVQGQVTIGGAVAITAFANARMTVEALQIGDMVTAGQTIARQDTTNFERRLELLLLQRGDAELKLSETNKDIAADRELLAINTKQLALLEKKVARADELVSKNAISSEAAETALSASLGSRQQLVQRNATIAKKEFQLQQAKSTIARIDAEIKQVRADIKDMVITTPAAGQITFISPVSNGFSRQGDVIARILKADQFEVEAEIPVAHIARVKAAPIILATGLEGERIAMSLRALLPVQNARTGTRTMRFAVKGQLPEALQANNAVLVLQIPVSKPEPTVTVQKDAVVPIAGGHVVYVAEDGVAVQKRIKLGSAVADSFIVLDGLAANEPVIVRGNEALSDGKAIKVGNPGDVAKSETKAPKAKPAGEAWLLEWTTRRGPGSADLFIGKDKSTFNGEEITVVRAGDSINFIGQLFLPFGTLNLDFNGKVDGDKMAGDLVIRGLPGGREIEITFTGTKATD